MRRKYNLIHFLLAKGVNSDSGSTFIQWEGRCVDVLCVVDTQVTQQVMDRLQLNLLNFTEYSEFTSDGMFHNSAGFISHIREREQKVCLVKDVPLPERIG